MQIRRSLPRALAALALGVALALPAWRARAAEETVLSLTVTAQVSVPPDVLTADLRASAAAASAAAAQTAVNRAAAAAVADAHAVPGVSVSNAGYATWQVPPGSPAAGRWQANQTLALKSADAPALLRLVGRLQDRGLALGGLNWQLSPAARKKAEAKALQRALARLRTRADTAAELLGLRFVRFRSVQLGPQPHPFPRPMALGAAMAATPPSAPAAPIEVSNSVSAVAVLVAK